MIIYPCSKNFTKVHLLMLQISSFLPLLAILLNYGTLVRAFTSRCSEDTWGARVLLGIHICERKEEWTGLGRGGSKMVVWTWQSKRGASEWVSHQSFSAVGWNVWVFIPYLSQAFDAGCPGMVWPLPKRLSAAEAHPEGAGSWGCLLTSPSTAGHLVLLWRGSWTVCFCIYQHLTNSIKWEDHYPYLRGVIVGIQWDCTFKVLSPVARENNCSIILLFKPIEQTVLFPPNLLFYFFTIIIYCGKIYITQSLPF